MDGSRSSGHDWWRLGASSDLATLIPHYVQRVSSTEFDGV